MNCFHSHSPPCREAFPLSLCPLSRRSAMRRKPSGGGVAWCGVVCCGVVWCGVVWCAGVVCSVVNQNRKNEIRSSVENRNRKTELRSVLRTETENTKFGRFFGQFSQKNENRAFLSRFSFLSPTSITPTYMYGNSVCMCGEIGFSGV